MTDISKLMGGELTVELICEGEGAFSPIAAALGFSTVTVDINGDYRRDLSDDPLSIDAAKLPVDAFIVWAAPPASSVFNDKSAWAKDGSFYPETPEAERAMALIRKAVNLTTTMKPTWWFLEHPKSLLRGMPLFAGFNRGYPSRNRRTIRHDEYGGVGRQETDVWTNAYWWIPQPGDRDSDGGMDSGTRVPPFVFSEIFSQLEQYRVTGKYGPR